ncbi:ABC transporter ATP-binding protein [Paenibacillus tyrfis]|uniref:ABC transporter ATP-binding protein n=1 Tax=Paenibacillus tyrfis TaxID=1501230 RepID=UPI0020A1920D|nr:ABC transporter ATP-binding protein [Paenibacillus tyrfis]MCP1305613.1 ABC transporter ATP-binding protein [Paenibacillus tyrfis]
MKGWAANEAGECTLAAQNEWADGAGEPSEPVLELEHLTVYAVQGKAQQPLVRDLNLAIGPGEMLALVGESGSGKSVTAGAVLGLLPSSLRIGEGQIRFRGEEISAWPNKRKRQLRGKEMALVFQDYQGSFTPFLKVGKQLVEAVRSHVRITNGEAKELALHWLNEVDLPAERVFDSYPFQLSGGQRQRAALAAAMLLKPKLLIADEPTTALDVLTGERVLDLMTKLRRQTGCAILFISHDLRLVLKRADTIAVMQGGRIVEFDRADTIRRRAAHPYTRLLLESRPLLLRNPGTDRAAEPDKPLQLVP